MTNQEIKSMEVGIIVCNNCGDWVSPKHPETFEQMHNTECAECHDGLLQHRHGRILRIDDVIDLSERMEDTEGDEWRDDYVAGFNDALFELKKKLEDLSDGDSGLNSTEEGENTE